MIKILPLDYERDIPDYAETGFLQGHVYLLLGDFRNREQSDSEICEALLQLVIRIAENPGGIDQHCSDAIFEWLESHWPQNDADFLDTAVAVLINIGSPERNVAFLRSKLSSCCSIEESKIIEEALDEYSA